MAKGKDWLSGNRTEQLAMAKLWKTVLAAKHGEWGIPATVLTELDALIQAAETALTTAQNETTRTPVSTAQCKIAFDALVAFMRDIKRRYFLTPPLDEAGYVSLSLSPLDTNPTPSGTPTAQVTVEDYLIGRHELGVKISYVTGSPDDVANKGYRVWYTLVSHGETPPTNPDELRHAFFTKRRKDVLKFEFEDSGKKCYMAVRVENGSKVGPWGPLTSALIP